MQKHPHKNASAPLEDLAIVWNAACNVSTTHTTLENSSMVHWLDQQVCGDVSHCVRKYRMCWTLKRTLICFEVLQHHWNIACDVSTTHAMHMQRRSVVRWLDQEMCCVILHCMRQSR